jgi:hypothetical protein
MRIEDCNLELGMPECHDPVPFAGRAAPIVAHLEHG